jgi:hypothetical protein
MSTLKSGYNADAALTLTLASLASSTSLVAGRESTAVDNGTTLAVDYLVSGKITTGTSPTVNTNIEIWVVAPIEDTPTWPDVFDGTDSDESVTSRNVLFSCAALAHIITVDATSDRTYPVKPFSVAQLFGGVCPKQFGVFVVHNTGVALNATGSNHALYAQPILPTVA